MRAVRVEVIAPKKTRTALLEMRTALLEMPTAKLLRTNDKNNFIATKFCCLKNESWKWHSESEFYYPGELSYGEGR